MTAQPVPPTGAQFPIVAGPYQAVVTEAGATLRNCTWRGLPVLAGFATDAACDGAHGQLLAPWPNRVDRGRYAFDGVDHQLDVTEPAADNAIHGLVRTARWQPVHHDEATVTLTHRLLAQPGYPFVLDLTVTYALHEETGLTVTTSARNVGGCAAPWGTGHHPYLTPGLPSVRECTLRLPAASYLVADDRHIPRERAPVADTGYDFRTGRVIADHPLDPAFGDLARDADGLAHASVTAPDGATSALWCDTAYPWLQVFTGHTLAPARRFAAVAVEPMSCPPNAFVTGTDLVRLDPGAQWSGRWGVRFRPGREMMAAT
ncbi:MAG: aldose epimerase [Streptosporangiales bacterium]|nr:aldose epimerase [Streptosporangiales bacterium]